MIPSAANSEELRSGVLVGGENALVEIDGRAQSRGLLAADTQLAGPAFDAIAIVGHPDDPSFSAPWRRSLAACSPRQAMEPPPFLGVRSGCSLDRSGPAERAPGVPARRRPAVGGTVKGLEALRETLKADIARFDRESSKHKLLHRRCETTVIVLTTLASVVAGAGLVLPESSSSLQFAVLCLTATTSGVSSWSGMRRARELWQHEREVYYALLDIQREMEFVAGNRELTPAELTSLFERIAAVLGSSSQKWTRIQEKKQGPLKPLGDQRQSTD